MKVEIHDKSGKTTEVPVNAIPIGTMFEGEVTQERSVYLRIFGTLVDLRRPTRTWYVGDSSKWTVKIIRYLESVTLTQEPAA